METVKVHSSNFISNLDKHHKYYLGKAAEKTNTSIYFEDKAVNANGMILKNMISVYSSDVTQDYSKMWKEFNRLLTAK